MRVVTDMDALVYLRVSTEDQAEKGYSITAQREEGVNKAVELGCNPENIHIFSDEGVSGAVLERPQLMAALDMLKRGAEGTQYFICYDSSRLSRNAAHQLIIIDQIKKSNAKLIFIKNNYQDDAEGRFQLTVMAAVDEYERARLKLRTEMGKRAKAAQHKLTHNPGLYGYDFDPLTDKLVINEENGNNLKRIFSMFTEEHMSPAEIAERLNASEVPSPRMKQWSRVTIRRILSNPSYLGKLFIRRYDTRDYRLNRYKTKDQKSKVKERPQSEWIPVEIPQLIDRVVWDKAQNILKITSRICKRTEKGQFLLMPYLKCGICGSLMSGKKIESDERTYRYYICTNKYKDSKEERCQASLLRAEHLEKQVWEYVSRRIVYSAEQEVDFKKILDEYIKENIYNMKNIIRKKEKAKKEKERILTLFQKGYINEYDMKKKLETVDKKITELNDTAETENKFMIAFEEKLKDHWEKEKLPYIIKEILSGLEIEEKKHILGLLISEVTVTDDVVRIKGRL